MARIISKVYEAPFDEGKRLLEKEGFRIASLEETVRLRIKAKERSLIYERGNWVREAFLYIPNKGRFLVKESPLLDSPEEAIQSYKQGIEYKLSDLQIEKALENSIELNNGSIPTKKLDRDIFGKYARKYGKLLKKLGFFELKLLLYDHDYVNRQENPFAHQIWFSSISDSVLFGSIGQLYIKKRVLGVKDKIPKLLPKVYLAGIQIF